ncbi:MAG: hypothetical protein JWO82_2639 [Akkermansiaceae bacterium]|nr:hypothetical protein [Akkermansiaceae bacterium]
MAHRYSITFALQVGIGLAGLFVLLLIAPLLGVHWWIVQAAGRLLVGWIALPHRSISLMSWNWDTVLSGSLAAVLGLAAANYCGRRFISGWRWRTSFTLLAALPVLFFTSFLVPGVISNLKGLADGPISIRGSSAEDDRAEWSAKELATDLMTRQPEAAAYPMRLRAILVPAQSTPWHYFIEREGEFIFAGAGMPVDSPGNLALLISPAFVAQGGRVMRWCVRFDGSAVRIRDEEVPGMLREVTVRKVRPTAGSF